MTINIRTEEEQQRLNGFMRRKDVLEGILFRSLHAEPASAEQVKRFLSLAPPEVFVLLDGLLPLPLSPGIPGDAVHENRIVQGFVGMAISRKGA